MAKQFKRTYHEEIEKFIPGFYRETDLEISGLASSVVASIVNSHIEYAENTTSLLNPSATDNYTDLVDVSGIGSFFSKQNKRTVVTPREFELQIMAPMGSSLGDFTSSSLLKSFLEDTLLPKLTLNSSALASNTASAFDNEASGTHEFLIDALGWAYFLNTSGDSWDPSSYVAETLASKFLAGKTFDIADGIVGLTRYLWYNWADLSSVDSALLPAGFYSGTGEWVSGTQNLDKLETLVGIIYSTDPKDQDDTYVRDAFTSFLEVGDKLEEVEPVGPFHKVIKALSYSMFDTNQDVDGIKDLYDLSKCPSYMLPYVADLIGWKLYGINEDSWRRQLRDAADLYKQKGTKKGLVNAIAAVLPGTTIGSEKVSEFYESYVPYLLYYMLKTESALFDSDQTWTQDKAESFTDGEYSQVDMDENVRTVIDHILLRAQQAYPELFYVKNYRFNPGHPDFEFRYRDRTFCMPPWEEEKFYADCDVSEGLVKQLENELICLGVSRARAKEFREYILTNTVNGQLDGKFFNNGMLFLTSDLQLPPNKEDVIETYDSEKLSLLPIWNGRSSHFDVDVSSGSFDDTFFVTGSFTRNDFFQSLQIIDEFTPAKAVPRTRVTLSEEEELHLGNHVCPSVRFGMFDSPLSGVAAGFQSSGVDIRSIDGAVGGDYPVPANSGRAQNDHTNLPVFKREAADDSYDFINLAGSAVSAVPVVDADRTSVRRRDYINNVKSDGLYTRTGFNQPSYLNTSNEGSDFEFWPLGLLPTELEYHPVVSALDLLAVSSSPYDLDVWSDCWDSSSSRDISGLHASSFFLSRGDVTLERAKCDPYIRRDQVPGFYYFLWSVLDSKIQREAEKFVETNDFLFNQKPHLNAVQSVKSWMWEQRVYDVRKTLGTKTGKRYMGIDSPDGIHKSFKDYIAHFTAAGLGNQNLTSRLDGGLNLLSHTYGPLLYNGRFTVEGSGLGLAVSSQLLAKDIGSEQVFNLLDVQLGGEIDGYLTTPTTWVGKREVVIPHILSGVELVDNLNDSNKSTAEFSLFNFDASAAIDGRENYLVGNTITVMKPTQNLPRLRFNVKDYGPNENLLIPERDFELTLKALVGTEGSNLLGGGDYGVWIHTDIETGGHTGKRWCWTYMPNGKWEKTDVDALNATTGINLVKDKLSHYLSYQETIDPSGVEKTCAAQDSIKSVLVAAEEGDFLEKTLRFNTRNQPIEVGLLYYQDFKQVHRENQRYIIEVFPVNQQSTDTFFAIDHVSVVDLRLNNRANQEHTFSISDYSKSKDAILEDCVFFDPSGVEVSAGTQMKIDSSGEITDASGNKITLGKSLGALNIKAKTTLFSQVRAYIPTHWVQDAGGTPIQRKEREYDGVFSYDGEGVFSPSNLVFEGAVKGSHIAKLFNNELIPYTPEELLAAMREFDRLQSGLAARDASISADQYGPQGGSRLNYRSAPMWTQNGGYNTFLASDNVYTDVRLDN